MSTSNSNMLRWSGNAMVGRAKKALRKADIEFAPSIDQVPFYDPPRERSASPDNTRFSTNIGHKAQPSARFARRGKMYSWGPGYEDLRDQEHVRKRMKVCLEQFMPESSVDTGIPLPINIADDRKRHNRDAQDKAARDQWLLPHLRSPSPPLSTEELAPMLALPQSYVDIMMSPSMRHTLGDDSVEQGLHRTASDLLESEKPLLQSLGRLKDILRLQERDVPAAEVGQESTAPEKSIRKQLLPLPHASDTDNLWRVTQELLQQQTYPPTISYSGSRREDTQDPPTQEELDELKLTPIQRLFTREDGIFITATPAPQLAHQTPIQYNIDIWNQVTAVDDAMERIHELMADCNEYKTRLEEARDRIADVARARKKVWSVIKDRAGAELDKYEGKEVPEVAAGQLL